MSQHITNNVQYHTHNHYEVKWEWPPFCVGMLVGSGLTSAVILLVKWFLS